MKRLLSILLLCLLPATAPAQTKIFALKMYPVSDWVQIGDIHSGGTGGAHALMREFTNAISSILESNRAADGSKWYVTDLISPGDCYVGESNTLTAGWVGIADMTNWLGIAKAAGVNVITSPGNHDSDQPGYVNIWSNHFPMSFFSNSNPAYVTSWTNGDTRAMVFARTNSGTKFLFITWPWFGPEDGYGTGGSTQDVITAYSPATNWARGIMRQYPNHKIINVMHYFLNREGSPDFFDREDHQGYNNIGPGLAAWWMLQYEPNSVLVMCGHQRFSAQTVAQLTCSDGHIMGAYKLNTQTFVSGTGGQIPDNAGTIVHYRFNPNNMTITARPFNALTRTWMTNRTDSVQFNITTPWNLRL